jgi:hypothetical protein
MTSSGANTWSIPLELNNLQSQIQTKLNGKVDNPMTSNLLAAGFTVLNDGGGDSANPNYVIGGSKLFNVVQTDLTELFTVDANANTIVGGTAIVTTLNVGNGVNTSANGSVLNIVDIDGNVSLSSGFQQFTYNADSRAVSISASSSDPFMTLTNASNSQTTTIQSGSIQVTDIPLIKTTTITPISVTSDTFIGAFSGSASNLDVTDTSTNSTFYPVFSDGTGTGKTIYADRTTGPLEYNPSSGLLTTNSLSLGTTTTTSSGTTIVLTVNSTPYRIITGSTAQTIQLPDATTLKTGIIYYFNNNSSANITVQNNGAVTLYTVIPGAISECILRSGATVNGTWDFHSMTPNNVQFGTNNLNFTGASNTTIQHTGAGTLQIGAFTSTGAINLNTNNITGGGSITAVSFTGTPTRLASGIIQTIAGGGTTTLTTAQLYRIVFCTGAIALTLILPSTGLNSGDYYHIVSGQTLNNVTIYQTSAIAANLIKVLTPTASSNLASSGCTLIWNATAAQWMTIAGNS